MYPMRPRLNKRVKYAHTLSLRKAFLCGLFAVCLCLARPASAIEKYTAIPLPDDGRGSTARAVAQADPLHYSVVGSQRSVGGWTDAVYWSIAVDPSDPSGNTVYATQLPRPSGWNAEATGIAFLEGDPDRPVICGNLIGTDGGVYRAALWRRDASGQFTNTMLDDEASQANAVTIQNTPLGLIIVVCGKYRLPDGDWHACLWEIGPEGRRRIDLGTLGGRNSEATALAYVDDLIGWDIVGRAQMPDGRWIAALWSARLMEEEGIYHFIQTLPTPPGAQSQASSITHTYDGDLYIMGGVTGANDRTSATVWTLIPDGTSNTVLFGSLTGYRNSTANGIIINGLGGDDALTVGTAWNTNGDSTGFGALPFLMPVEDVFSIDALRTETVSKDETITIGANAVGPGGAIVGEGQRAGASNPQAMLFLPTNREVPQIIAILIGQILLDPEARGDSARNLTALWQQDGRGLRFAPRKDQKKPQVAVEFGFRPLSPPSEERTPKSLSFGGKITPRTPNRLLSWTVTAQVYSSAFGVWVTVGQFAASQEYFQKTLEIPDPARFLLPSDEPLRTRLVVTPRTGGMGKDWFITLDFIEQENQHRP